MSNSVFENQMINSENRINRAIMDRVNERLDRCFEIAKQITNWPEGATGVVINHKTNEVTAFTVGENWADPGYFCVETVEGGGEFSTFWNDTHDYISKAYINRRVRAGE